MNDIILAPKQAAYVILESQNWTISNNRLQKILYLMEMIYVGENKKRLISEDFRANLMGPIIPSLYKEFEVFGARNISSLPKPSGFYLGNQINFIKKWSETLNKKTNAELVAMTQWSRGGWAKRFMVGYNPGMKITTSDMLCEFNARKAKVNAQALAKENMLQTN